MYRIQSSSKPHIVYLFIKHTVTQVSTEKQNRSDCDEEQISYMKTLDLKFAEVLCQTVMISDWQNFALFAIGSGAIILAC